MLNPRDRRVWAALATLVALVIYLSTLQTIINGSDHPYTTDVGEIQNALPRWGLIHRSGYPLYTALGSLFVTVGRGVGIQPAAGASLFSALWGAAAAGLLVVLAQELGAPGPAAALGALLATLSTSMWVDASIAEVHTLTQVFRFAALIAALRFGRTGDKWELLLLTLLFAQGVTHQRTVALLAPTLLLLVWPRWRTVQRHLGPTLLAGLLSPLTYLYMPIRVWTGATWVFGSPGTWDGFWSMVLDNRAERIARPFTGVGGLLTRLSVTGRILDDDMWWPLLLVGLLGLWLPMWQGKKRESVALTLAWIPSLLVTVVIWRGQVGDAQLATKLPVVMMAGVGWTLFLAWLWRRSRPIGAAAAGLFLAALLVRGYTVRPLVLSITRDPFAETVIATAEQVAPPPTLPPTTLASLWGRDFWSLAYAQAYQNRLPGLDLVDHNADFRGIVESDHRLLVLSRTFYVLPVSWWEEHLGCLHLTVADPGVVHLRPTPLTGADGIPADVAFDLGNGLAIRSAHVAWDQDHDQLHVIIYWEAMRPLAEDYSVAVHLVSHDPPRDGGDILAQADSAHPVEGWYPTSRWTAGEIVRDAYRLTRPPGTEPIAVRIGMYQRNESGEFVNTEWLSLSLATP